MSLAQSFPEPRRTEPVEPPALLTPPLVPRLREYRVVPQDEHRRMQYIQVAVYVLCFVVGIAAGLLVARLLSAPSTAGTTEKPQVIIRTLK